MRPDAMRVDQPGEHLGRAVAAVTDEPARIEVKPLQRALHHALGGQCLRLPDCRRRLNTEDDRVLDVDQVVRRVGKKAWPPCAPVQRAAGSEGDTNFGVTSVAAPKAASSRTVGYSSMARPAAAGGSPLSLSVLFCRLASALIKLASTANHRPAAPHAAAQLALEHASEEIALPEAAVPVLGERRVIRGD